MNILYIENNIADTKHAQSLFSGTIHQFKISHDFEESIRLLLTEHIDFVVYSENAGKLSFSEYRDFFLGMPHFMLLNEPEHHIQKSLSAPLATYPKPLKKEHIDDMSSIISSIQQQANLDYAEDISMGDYELLKELVLLLKKQFIEAEEKIPYLYQHKNGKELIQIIHKLISKFAILSMNDSFLFFSHVEKYLRSDFELKPYTYKRLLTDIRTGINFINHYIELNELHNS